MENILVVEVKNQDISKKVSIDEENEEVMDIILDAEDFFEGKLEMGFFKKKKNK